MSRITDELIEDVQKYARAISSGDNRSMDYAQDALLRIAEKEGEFDSAGPASFHTWATRVAINTIINSIKSVTSSERRDLDWASENYPDHTDRLQRWLSSDRTTSLPVNGKNHS